MKNRKITILLVIILFVGLSLLLYPPISNWWNSYRQSKVMVSYAGAISKIDNETYKQLLEDARAYNKTVASKGGGGWKLSDTEQALYDSLLNVDGSGVIGYIDIPKIHCTLPIYHGTSDGVLQIAVGHNEGTSLPVGGESTHCVLSGHRGLPSARLFTDLDQMTVGDVFTINTLDEVLTYEVDQIHIVLPHEISELRIEPGQDLCTLLTCTPYGINTHRLLVRGHRIDTVKEHDIRVIADSVQVEPPLVALFIGAPILLLLTLVVLLLPIKPRKQIEIEEEIEL